MADNSTVSNGPFDAHVTKLSLYAPGFIHDDGVVSHTHFFQTAWIALVMLAVRYIAQKVLLQDVHAFLVLRPYFNLRTLLDLRLHSPWTQTVLPILKCRVNSGAQAVFDNVYLLVWSCLTEALAIYVMLFHNGGCRPWSTDACMAGWPSHPVHVLHKWYMILMFQYYLHEMIGAVIGVCPRIRKDMIVHHVGIMSLIFIAYSINLNRFGIMGQGLFDSSNPFLHAAKALHSAQIPEFARVKWLLFNMFAVVFFIARVAAAPGGVLWPSYSRGFGGLPLQWARILVPLMAIMCAIQWLWFYKIIQMALGKGPKDGPPETAQDRTKAE